MSAPAQRIVLPRSVDKNGEVIKGTNREASVDRLDKFALALPLDKGWAFEVTEARRRRSHEQNRALWGVAYKTLSDATGNAADDLHEFFLGEWSGWDVIDVMGAKRRVPKRRSSKLTTTEFCEFYAFIQQRAAEVGYYVPDPGEL